MCLILAMANDGTPGYVEPEQPALAGRQRALTALQGDEASQYQPCADQPVETTLRSECLAKIALAPISRLGVTNA